MKVFLMCYKLNICEYIDKCTDPTDSQQYYSSKNNLLNKASNFLENDTGSSGCVFRWENFTCQIWIDIIFKQIGAEHFFIVQQ